MDQITCPHCKETFPMSEALTHELKEKVRIEETAKLKERFKEEKAKEQAAREKELRLEFEKDYKEKASEVEELKRKERVLAEKLAQEQEERGKIEEKARIQAEKKAEESQSLKLKEKDIQVDQIKKVAEDLRRANEDLKRKLEQGSQQMQGEALELDFENKLKSTFPGDEFLPVPKGVEGGDIWQKVRFNGKEVGSILWETKRTKAWANSWTTKLKDDAAKISASESIIVTSVLPNGMNNFDRKDGVWVTTYEHVINIARYVRFLITSVHNAKSSSSHTEEEWSAIRDYMLSDSFKHRMQAHFDGVKALRNSLEAERRATTLRWKKQESQISKLDMNTVNFYGELKSIVSNLPELEEIETPLIAESADENSNETLF